MNRRGSFYRKVGYGVAIALLLFPIAWLGAPSTRAPGNEGGKLAQLRSEYDLGQADIGEIDPAGEAIRLATLGMRGIATTLLWSKANEYKKTENWTEFSATLSQLARLQPYVIAFWRFQAWNLTYNVSVEVDDVEDRFYYVIRGIDFLKQGAKYNRDSPYLLEELGWFIGNKIGRADEHEIYRKLFKYDEDYHPKDRPLAQRDNWLVAQLWYNKAVEAVDEKKKSLGNKNPTTFFEKPARTQISYATAIEEEGVFGRRAEEAWAKALAMWRKYGNRELRASNGILIRLAGLEETQQVVEKLLEELNALAPGLREELEEQGRKSVTEAERDAQNIPYAERTPEQAELAEAADAKLNVTFEEIAREIAKRTPAEASKARRIVNQLTNELQRARMIDINRGVVMYKYWEASSEMEQSPDVLKARELAFEARNAFKKEGKLLPAKELYDRSFTLWAKAFEEHPEIEADSAIGADVMEAIEKYKDVLDQLDVSLSDPELADAFPLWNIIEANDQERLFQEALEKHLGRAVDTESIPIEQRPLMNPADIF